MHLYASALDSARNHASLRYTFAIETSLRGPPGPLSVTTWPTLDQHSAHAQEVPLQLSPGLDLTSGQVHSTPTPGACQTLHVAGRFRSRPPGPIERPRLYPAALWLVAVSLCRQRCKNRKYFCSSALAAQTRACYPTEL